MTGDSASRSWTEDQHRAIVTVGRNILVSAAAGSGKTSVLAERCVHLVCDAPDPHRCEVDELLVVTFTRAAAAEMRGRIDARLRERAASVNDARLSRQLSLIGKADIGTLHGLCGRIVRRHFAALGIDPTFTTLDEHEALLVRRDVVRGVLDARFDLPSGAALGSLIEGLSGGRESVLTGLILSIHELLNSVVDPIAWADAALHRVRHAAEVPLIESRLGREFLQAVRDQLDRWSTAAARIGQDLQGRHGEFEATCNAIAQRLAALHSLLSTSGYDTMAVAFCEFISNDLKLPTGRKSDGGDACRAVLFPLYNDIREGWLASACRFSTGQFQQDLKSAAANIELLLDLVVEFQTAYTGAKQALRSLDFSDLERLALRVLQAGDPRNPIPSSAALEYQQRYRHVLVDEYQDINALQDQILRLLSHESAPPGSNLLPNFFCVGDVKQSIYRFRLADPDQFLRRAESYRTDPSRGLLIHLSDNFRSDPHVLDAINSVFARVMSRAGADVEYDQDHHLRPGRPSNEYHPVEDPVQLHILSKPKSGASDDAEDGEGADIRSSIEREASLVADVILKLTGSGVARPRKFGDFAVLLRAMQVKAEQFAEVLRSRGIAVHADASTGFFNAPEIRDALSLLQCLDNPRQDIPLAALLRSPLIRLIEPDDAFARIRLRHPRPVPFHAAVFRYAASGNDDLAENLRQILRQLDSWRDLAQSRPLAGVIWQIFRESGYLGYCAALAGGEQRVANLLFLHDKARQFGEFRQQGLRWFLDFLLSLENETDLGLPGSAADPGDVVRVLSIHRSKGLQFPVVFLPDLAKSFNLTDLNKTVLVEREAGIAPQAFDLERRARWPTLAHVAARTAIRSKAIAEEMRVLYVGMTRAEQQLILIASVVEPGESVARWSVQAARATEKMPLEQVISAKSMLDWVGPAAVAKPDLISIHLVEDEGSSPIHDQRADGPAESLRRLQPLPADPPPAGADEVIDLLSWRHPMRGYSFIPASQAVTTLTKAGRSTGGGESPSIREVVKFAPPLAMPRFFAPEVAATPAQIGSATHRVLQCIDFCTHGTPAAVDAEIRRLRERGMISEEDALAVNRASIAWFLGTEIAERLRSSESRVMREVPIFAGALPPSGDGVPLPQSDDPMDRVLERGQIDVLVETAAGLLVLDYKTDHVTPETIGQRAEFYRPQVAEYCRMIELITRQPVVGRYLIFLHPQLVVEV